MPSGATGGTYAGTTDVLCTDNAEPRGAVGVPHAANHDCRRQQLGERIHRLMMALVQTMPTPQEALIALRPPCTPAGGSRANKRASGRSLCLDRNPQSGKPRR